MKLKSFLLEKEIKIHDGKIAAVLIYCRTGPTTT